MNYLPFTVSNELLNEMGTISTAQGIVLLGYGMVAALLLLLWTVGCFTLGARPKKESRPHRPRLSHPERVPTIG